MANIVAQYAKRGVVKAHRAGNTVLEHGLNHTAYYYQEGTAAQSISRATAVKDLIANNLPILTNITTSNVAAIQAAITAFEAVKDVPTTVSQTQKIQGTNQIAQLLEKMDKLIDHMGYLVQSYFDGTPLEEEFELKSKLLILGTRSNSVTIHIEDAATAKPISKAIANNNGNGKTAEANNDGIALFDSVRVGNQPFTITAQGYTTQHTTIKVVRGTNTEVVVRMGRG